MRRALIRLSLLVLAGILLAPGAPAGGGVAPGPRPFVSTAVAITASQYAPDSQECAMLKLINDYRVAHGKSRLKLSRTLGAAAEHHSRDMAAHNSFSHTLSNGTSWTKNITNHGYPTGTYRAENIAAGNSLASKTFTQWKNSSGHRTNMLNGTYKAIGIGRAYGSSATYKWYWTTTFGNVVDQTIAC
jgi:uncharacterized protein YkwD